MNDDVCLTLSALVAAPWERGELIAMGQVAMATDNGGRSTMLTGGIGSLIGRLPSGTREDVVTGVWTVCTLHGALREVGGVD